MGKWCPFLVREFWLFSPLKLAARSACMDWKKYELEAMSFKFKRGFRASTTWLIRGLTFGSRLRQACAS
jgi:hypothetical protein